MKSSVKLGLSLICIAAIVVLGCVWRARQLSLRESKLVEAAQACRAKAEQGDATAQADLGSMYLKGSGVEQSYTEALRWYQKAANEGNAIGEDGLAHLYRTGMGVTQDNATALEWYRKAANQGYAKAEAGLGYMYSNGLGTLQDYSEGLRWYQKAANQQDATAEYNLGRMYWYGNGIRSNRDEAHRWILKAAEDGDEAALLYVSKRPTLRIVLILLVQLIYSLGLATSSVSFGLWMPGRRLSESRQKLIVATGILGLFLISVIWYGCTHHLFWRLDYRITLSSYLTLLLYAAWIGMLVYSFLWPRSNTSLEALPVENKP